MNGPANNTNAESGIEVRLHQLSHLAMDHASRGQVDQAEQVLGEALALARQKQQPVWEAQTLLDAGRIFDRLEKPLSAVGYLEQARRLFGDQGQVRMEVTASILLGNMLAKSGEGERAWRVLEVGRERAEQGLVSHQLAPDEHAYLLFGLYRELGMACRVSRQFEQALSLYQQALGITSTYLGLPELNALLREIVVLYTESGNLDEALSFGRDLLERTNTEDEENLPLLMDLSFQLGLICLRADDYTSAVRYNRQAYDYFKQVYPRPFANPALEGRIFTNTGNAYNGLLQFEQALAYWRIGESRLAHAGVADVTFGGGDFYEQRKVHEMASWLLEAISV
jgi:tetratricopeptide (TPR) repeat protein